MSGGAALQEQVHLAQYSHLPVGSMHGDWALQTLDALFGRRLRDGGHLLWLADPALPDIAGSADPTAVDDRFFAEEAGTEVRGIGRCAGKYHLGVVLRQSWMPFEGSIRLTCSCCDGIAVSREHL